MPRENLPVHAVILAGGRGTRFWPRSRTKTPKQLPKASRVRVLVEPVGRNTAAAVALAAFHIQHFATGDALMAVLPADHYIAQTSKYQKIVAAALHVAREPGRMVVLGIPPTRPETGFGYIERTGTAMGSNEIPVYAVRRFAEKPGLETAKEYLASGNYQWNAGMFFWRVSTILVELKKHLPRTFDVLQELAAHIGTGKYATQLRKVYPKLENISVDYAILERATSAAAKPQVFVIPAEVGWSDIGSG